MFGSSTANTGSLRDSMSDDMMKEPSAKLQSLITTSNLTVILHVLLAITRKMLHSLRLTLTLYLCTGASDKQCHHGYL